MLLPQPKVKPPLAWPMPERQLELPEPPFDPSAFWLYPDWSGPEKQPFWMRPLKLPEPRMPQAPEGPAPMALMYGQARVEPNFVTWHGGAASETVAFMVINGETFVETLVDGEHRLERVQREAIEAGITPDEQRKLTLKKLRNIQKRRNFAALILE